MRCYFSSCTKVLVFFPVGDQTMKYVIKQYPMISFLKKLRTGESSYGHESKYK